MPKLVTSFRDLVDEYTQRHKNIMSLAEVAILKAFMIKYWHSILSISASLVHAPVISDRC